MTEHLNKAAWLEIIENLGCIFPGKSNGGKTMKEKKVT